jgi:hypothetical protein
MEPWTIALLVKPLASVVFLAVVVYPIERVIQRAWPEGWLKQVLFDPTFQRRHPWRYMAVWTIAMAVMIGAVAIWLEVRS